MDTGNKSEVGSQKSEVKKDRKTNNPAIFYITNEGYKLAQRIQTLYPDAKVLKFTSVGAIHELPLAWNECKALIFIMATGIVVRTMAPLLKDKRTDPAVVVLDEKGEYVISLLSGHIGGANKLAGTIADYLGAQAVITTASDVQGKVALDVWASGKNLNIENAEKLKKLSSRIVNGRKIKLYAECHIEFDELPAEFIPVKSDKGADLIISNRIISSNALFLRPKNLFAGIGCNRGAAKEEIREIFDAVFHRAKLSILSINSICTIDLKKDEKGILDFAHDAGLSMDFFSKDELNDASKIYNIKESRAVKAATGAAAVAEPAALLSAGRISNNISLIIPKEKRGNVTLAIAEARFTL